jgi:hypothetical protein
MNVVSRRVSIQSAALKRNFHLIIDGIQDQAAFFAFSMAMECMV